MHYRAAWLVFVVSAFVLSGFCIKESIDGEIPNGTIET
jgi:hypothetical protein